MTVSLPPPPERARAEAPSLEPASHAAHGRTTPSSLEATTWLEADGRGGYACLGHDGGAPRHSHEGLLVVPHGPRRLLHVLVSTLEERVACAAREPHVADGPPCADSSHDRGLGQALAPTCVGFDASTHPAWSFSLSAGGTVVLTLRREVLQPRGRHATLVRWTLLDGDTATLVLRPCLPFRPAHVRTGRNPRVTPDAVCAGGAVFVRPYPGFPALRLGADQPLDFRAAPRWISALPRPGERAGEDQFSPGELHVSLSRGVPFTLEVALSQAASPSPEAAFRREVARRVVASRADRAAERFLAHTDEGRATVLSGWPVEHGAALQGTETFSALPGLTFARGAHDLGLRVLVDALPFLDVGLMPERFGVDPDASDYGAEAPGLWFAWATRRALASAPIEHAGLRAALHTIAERFADGLDLLDAAPSEARLVELALGADLAGNLALDGGRQARRWARVCRRASQLFRAQLGATASMRPRLVAAMLERSPLDHATRRALVADLAERVERGATPSLDPDELAWFTEATLRIAPATRPRLAALDAAWQRQHCGAPQVERGAAEVAARLAARASLEGSPR